MKIASADPNAGLEAPDRSFRAKPDKNGVIEWPDRLAAYGELAAKQGPFQVIGRQFGGYGEGKLPKPYRSQPQEVSDAERAAASGQ